MAEQTYTLERKVGSKTETYETTSPATRTNLVAAGWTEKTEAAKASPSSSTKTSTEK